MVFLCEGDSASKFAKDGIAYLGYDKFGVYCLGGKPINATKSTLSTLGKNATVINLAKILGLPLRTVAQINDRQGLDIKKLRYGKIVMLKDADTDGAHIMGLTINLLEQLYPEILEIDGFFNEFITPMIKLVMPINLFNSLKINTNTKIAGTIIKTAKNVIYPFYNKDAYTDFIKKYPQCSKIHPVYVKGLGGHNSKETIEYFKNYLINVIGVSMDENADEYLNIAFDQHYTAHRKEIIQSRTGEHSLPRYIGQPITCSDFINNDWIDYSYDACVRSIPSAIDGLKPSQRKVLYVLLNHNYKPLKSCDEENKDRYVKVFQLCGEVALKGYYHHGDQSMNKTIIAMAQDFAGSNNLPLLAYDGGFGSRDENGEDAGAPRYIGATIHEVARYIYPKEDDVLLTPNIEDNTEVEPIYYVPIVPMLLINGSIGIGTGYSTEVPQYHPLDIIDNVKAYLHGENDLTFNPHYNFYKGEIENVDGKKYNIYGCYEIDGLTVRVTEIPFKLSKQEFLDRVKELYQQKIILNWNEYPTESINDFDILITFSEDSGEYLDDAASVASTSTTTTKKKPIKIKVSKYTDEGYLNPDYVEKILQLKDSISLNNMNAFNSQCSLTTYEGIMGLFIEWFNTRENLYIRRKAKIESDYEKEILQIGERARFIKLVIENKLIINKRPKIDIIADLRDKFKFKTIDNDENYGYLLSLPLLSLTKEKYDELCTKYKNLSEEYEHYKSLPISSIWLSELEQLEKYLTSAYPVDKW